MRNQTQGTRTATTAGLAVALALIALPLQAQERDARWLPFVGCWEAVGAEDEIGLLCFTQADGGVDLTNYVNGAPVSTEFLAADGRQRPVAAEGCDGWESVEFSEDGRRAFTRTEFNCAEGDTRTGTGVMAFTAPDFWVDVRVLDVAGEEVAWVQGYQLAGNDRLAEEGLENPAAELAAAVRPARMAAAAPIDLDDVEEASARMGDRAVETWVVARGDEFDLDADDLIRLADAGVSDRVIDALIAVSHPERFVVEAGAPAERVDGQPGPNHYRGYMGFNPWAGPAYGFGYDDYWPYGYSPIRSFYGYGPWGPGSYRYGYGFYGSRPGYVIIDRRPSASGGRVYRDRGYRSGPGATSTGRSAMPRSGSTPSMSRGGAGSGSVAPSRGGTGRRATPRKAKRRGGGSGGF